MKLYDYWRSSASFRVRIALNLKQVPYDRIPVDLRLGEQQGKYRELNPSGLVPALSSDNDVIAQSLAILDYLDNKYPEPGLLPSDLVEKAHVQALAQDIACDMHPLNNLRVLNYLKDELNVNEQQVTDWYHHWLKQGFDSLEQKAVEFKSGDWFYHNQLSLADVLLIPQIYNAIRYHFDMSAYPQLMQIYNYAMSQETFIKAAPESLNTEKT